MHPFMLRCTKTLVVKKWLTLCNPLKKLKKKKKRQATKVWGGVVCFFQSSKAFLNGASRFRVHMPTLNAKEASKPQVKCDVLLQNSIVDFLKFTWKVNIRFIIGKGGSSFYNAEICFPFHILVYCQTRE